MTPSSFPINEVNDLIISINNVSLSTPYSMKDLPTYYPEFYEFSGELCLDVENAEDIGSTTLELQHESDTPYSLINIPWEPAEIVGTRPRRRPHTV